MHAALSLHKWHTCTHKPIINPSRQIMFHVTRSEGRQTVGMTQKLHWQRACRLDCLHLFGKSDSGHAGSMTSLSSCVCVDLCAGVYHVCVCVPISKRLLSPKSHILRGASAAGDEYKIFSGFKSRCTIPALKNTCVRCGGGGRCVSVFGGQRYTCIQRANLIEHVLPHTGIHVYLGISPPAPSHQLFIFTYSACS